MEQELGERVDPSVARMDLLVDHVNLLLARMDEVIKHDSTTTTQTVIHKTAGMGPWGAAAVSACFFTFLGLILFGLVVMPELHDNTAWANVLRTQVASLQQSVNALKEEKNEGKQAR